MFSKFDTNSGLYQIPLDPRSAKLTTFITPFGRYYYNRSLSALKHFRGRISVILSGVAGTVSMIDDALVFSKNQEQHDKHLAVVLEKIQKAGLTLNNEKLLCQQMLPVMDLEMCYSRSR